MSQIARYEDPFDDPNRPEIPRLDGESSSGQERVSESSAHSSGDSTLLTVLGQVLDETRKTNTHLEKIATSSDRTVEATNQIMRGTEMMKFDVADIKESIKEMSE